MSKRQQVLACRQFIFAENPPQSLNLVRQVSIFQHQPRNCHFCSVICVFRARALKLIYQIRASILNLICKPDYLNIFILVNVVNFTLQVLYNFVFVVNLRITMVQIPCGIFLCCREQWEICIAWKITKFCAFMFYIILHTSSIMLLLILG